MGLERKADKNEDKEEADIKVDEMKKDTEDIKVNDIQSVGKSEEDPGHLRTYILVTSEDAFINLTNHVKWHPMSQQQAYQAFNVMFNLAQKMFEDMDDLDNLDNKKGTLRGWQDDRRQLRIPQYHPQYDTIIKQEGI